MIVVDTNLIAYFWIPGKQTELIEQVFEKDPDWIVPILWRSEFRSVLAGFIRTKDLSIKNANKIISAAESYFEEKEFIVSSADVLDLVAKSSCSAFDCEFVALAKDRQMVLVSSDKALLKSFPKYVKSPQEFLGH